MSDSIEEMKAEADRAHAKADAAYAEMRRMIEEKERVVADLEFSISLKHMEANRLLGRANALMGGVLERM